MSHRVPMPSSTSAFLITLLIAAAGCSRPQPPSDHDAAFTDAGGDAEPIDGAAAPDAAAPADGYLTLLCDPSCDEVLDGSAHHGPSPLLDVPLSPGEHTIIFRAGTNTHRATIVIAERHVTIARLSPDAPDPPGIAASPAAEDEDWRIRRSLEPRVWSGKATIDEIKLLAKMCRRSGDRACALRAEAMLEKRLGRR